MYQIKRSAKKSIFRLLRPESLIKKTKYEGSIEDSMQFFCINGPAILFPYIRAYLSSLSALSGIPLILLPTINMTGLAETLKSNIKITE